MREGGNQKKDENEQAMPVFVKMLAKPLKRLEAVFSEVICNYHSQQLYLSRLVDYIQPEIEVPVDAPKPHHHQIDALLDLIESHWAAAINDAHTNKQDEPFGMPLDNASHIVYDCCIDHVNLARKNVCPSN